MDLVSSETMEEFNQMLYSIFPPDDKIAPGDQRLIIPTSE